MGNALGLRGEKANGGDCMGRVSFWGDKNIQNLDCGDGCTVLNMLRKVALYPVSGRRVYANHFLIQLFKSRL